MKKIISVILLISLLFNCCSNIVYANDLGDNQNESVGKIYTYVNQGNIRVDGYEDENGNKIETANKAQMIFKAKVDTPLCEKDMLIKSKEGK